MLKRIHVNRHVIAANRKNGTSEPVVRVKMSGRNVAAHSVKILGPSEVVYRPEKPLSCGAVLWVETRAAVDADGEVIE